MTTTADVTVALFQLMEEDNFRRNIGLLELAEMWIQDDLIKAEIAKIHDDFENDGVESVSLINTLSYLLEHPFIVGDNSTLMGVKEFADFLGWDKARLSTKYSRQRDGRKVRPLLPEPIQVLAATPVWTKAQAIKYKDFLESKSSQ